MFVFRQQLERLPLRQMDLMKMGLTSTTSSKGVSATSDGQIKVESVASATVADSHTSNSSASSTSGRSMFLLARLMFTCLYASIIIVFKTVFGDSQWQSGYRRFQMFVIVFQMCVIC